MQFRTKHRKIVIQTLITMKQNYLVGWLERETERIREVLWKERFPSSVFTHSPGPSDRRTCVHTACCQRSRSSLSCLRNCRSRNDLLLLKSVNQSIKYFNPEFFIPFPELKVLFPIIMGT